MTFAPGLSEPQNSPELACSTEPWHLPTGACGKVGDILQMHRDDLAEASPLHPLSSDSGRQIQCPELLVLLTPALRPSAGVGGRGLTFLRSRKGGGDKRPRSCRLRKGVPPLLLLAARLPLECGHVGSYPQEVDPTWAALILLTDPQLWAGRLPALPAVTSQSPTVATRHGAGRAVSLSLRGMNSTEPGP